MEQLIAILGLMLLVAFVVERILYRKINKDIDIFVKELREMNKHDSGDKKGE